MRVTFVGASPLAVLAIKVLTERGHEAVLIDQDPEKLEALSDELDCGLMTGDGTRPAVLAEVGPEQTDFLFCVSDWDETNILCALVGRSLGFGRVIPKLDEPDLASICTELGLDDVIVPDHQVAIQLADLVEGRDSPELHTLVRSGLRFFGFEVPDDVANGKELQLPEGARLIARTRGEESVLADADTAFEAGDEVVLLAAESEIEALRKRFGPDEDSDAQGQE